MQADRPAETDRVAAVGAPGARSTRTALAGIWAGPLKLRARYWQGTLWPAGRLSAGKVLAGPLVSSEKSDGCGHGSATEPFSSTVACHFP
jgi:hypothetical protein